MARKPEDAFDRSRERKLQRALIKLKEQKRYVFVVCYEPHMLDRTQKPRFSVGLIEHLKANRHCTISYDLLPLLMRRLGLIDDRALQLGEEYLQSNPVGTKHKEKAGEKSAAKISVDNGRKFSSAVVGLCHHMGLTTFTKKKLGFRSVGKEYEWDVVTTNGHEWDEMVTDIDTSGIQLWLEAKSQSTDGTMDDKIIGSICIINRILHQFFHNGELLKGQILDGLGYDQTR